MPTGFNDVLGITYRQNNHIIDNPNRPLIKDLDELPFPAYHLLPVNIYQSQKNISNLITKKDDSGTASIILTSRGCPYNCIFCATRTLWGRNARMRSPQNVLEEITFLKDKYKIKSILFLDDTFTFDKKRVEEICKSIRKEDIDISWSCITRVELFDKNMSLMLKHGQCNEVFFGLESGVQKTLDFLNKEFTLEDSVKAVKFAHEQGLEVIGNFVIGVPGETKEMINQTIRFAQKLNLSHAAFSILTPYPGTEIHKYAEKNNLLLTKDWSKYSYSNPVMKLPNLSNVELKGLLFKTNLIFSVKRLANPSS